MSESILPPSPISPMEITPVTSTPSTSSERPSLKRKRADSLDALNEAIEELQYSIKKNQPKSYDIEARNSKSFKGKVIRETTYNVKFQKEWNGHYIKDVKSTLNAEK